MLCLYFQLNCNSSHQCGCKGLLKVFVSKFIPQDLNLLAGSSLCNKCSIGFFVIHTPGCSIVITLGVGSKILILYCYSPVCELPTCREGREGIDFLQRHEGNFPVSLALISRYNQLKIWQLCQGVQGLA